MTLGPSSTLRCVHKRRTFWILKHVLCMAGCVGMNWIDLAYDRHRWRARMNAVMDIRVP
jgi:hypothetical protein